MHRELPNIALCRPYRMRVNVLVAGLGSPQNASVHNGTGDSLANGRVHADSRHLTISKKNTNETPDAPSSCIDVSMSDSPTFQGCLAPAAMDAGSLPSGPIPAVHPLALLAFNGREKLQLAGQREERSEGHHRFATVAA